MKYVLYGDGIHDDTDAIQELIDSGVCEVSLPAPEKNYLISRPLVIPSFFKLRLPRYAEIRLADGANCLMLKSKTKESFGYRQRECMSAHARELFKFINTCSPDKEDACHDFEIEGGIWNFNNMNQDPNPLYTKHFDERNYTGYVMLFYNARNFRLSNMTIKDPANFALVLDTASYFTVENITFDFNFGNPIATNMDGVHLNGNCHFGVIRNIKGACYDDLVALNAHEGSGGDITNIEIDGLFAENCHSAARMLTVNEKIEHITFSNVFGTYYQYCIGFTKYYPGETTGHFDAITLDNIHASKSFRLPVQEAHMGKTKRHFPLIWIQTGTVVKRVSIEHLHRREYNNPIDTLHIDEGALVYDMTLGDISLENHTDDECLLINNQGVIKKLITQGIDERDIVNSGSIEKLTLL